MDEQLAQAVDANMAEMTAKRDAMKPDERASFDLLVEAVCMAMNGRVVGCHVDLMLANEDSTLIEVVCQKAGMFEEPGRLAAKGQVMPDHRTMQ